MDRRARAARALRRRRRGGRWLRRGCGRRGRRRGMAPAALPGLLGKSRLPADSDVFVAIGELGHHRTGHAGIGLRHQSLQLGTAGGKRLALGLQLLAVVEIVFGGIGESRAQGIAHVGAAAEADAEREHGRRRGGAQQGRGKGNPKQHATLVNRQPQRLPKAGTGDGIEALP
jgi:hypothetical protein